MIANLQLPLQFDPEALKHDLSQAAAAVWTPHYNDRDYGGEWKGVALRSTSGLSTQLSARGSAFADTDLLDRCTYFRHVLSGFQCPLKAVRLLSLAPGSFIREHTDPDLGYEDGEVRIHVPIQTGPGVEFYSSGERLQLDEGSCYYINVSLPHRVSNRGAQDRVHLVIDAQVNDWVRALFLRGQPIAGLGPSKFAQLRNAILADPSLQQTLYALPDHPSLVESAVRLGQDLGLDLREDDLSASGAPLAERQPPPPWTPVRLHVRDARPVAEWVYFGDRPFTEPFFEDTARAALRNPFAQMFRHQAPLETSPGAAPSGLIFHMSRCGSTLAARMLSALPQTTVISEAPPIDDAIQAGRADWLRALVAAFIRPDRSCFVKFDSWHILSLPLIRAAFPQTPWIFLYRDPLEVLQSQAVRPGMMACPGAMDPAALGMRAEQITTLRREEWCARLFAGFLESALKYRHEPGGLFLNYRHLPEAMWTTVASHFSMTLTDTDVELMRETTRFHAKSPGMLFEADSEEKRRAASPQVHQLAAGLLGLYRELELIQESEVTCDSL